jgi:hypothetical protein
MAVPRAGDLGAGCICELRPVPLLRRKRRHALGDDPAPARLPLPEVEGPEDRERLQFARPGGVEERSPLAEANVRRRQVVGGEGATRIDPAP